MLIEFLVLVQLLIVPNVIQPQQTVHRFGIVEGYVLDPDGQPLKDAKVYAEPINGDIGGLETYAVTDANGHFSLLRVQAGKNTIFASKIEEQYADSRFAFFADDIRWFPTIDVVPGRTTPGVTIKMPRKGGRLSGRIVDAHTGKPVLTSRIKLYRDDNPEIFHSSGPDMNGYFEFIVPGRPFKIEITAQGYKTWKYPAKNQILIVQSGADKQFEVRLQSASQ